MRAIIFILGILLATNSNAQKFDCSTKTNEYQDLLKSNKIGESYAIWNDVRKNCPKENEAVYTDGIKILQYQIDLASPQEKEKPARDLMKLYDQYHKNFPASVPDLEIRKALALIRNRVEAKDEILNLLESGFSKSPQGIADVSAIFTYFSLYLEKFKAGNTKITANDVLDRYTKVTSLLHQLRDTHQDNSDYKTAEYGISKLVKEVATCENLTAYYAKNFESNKDNADWITAALVNLSGKCTATPTTIALSERLHAIKPSALSANFVAMSLTSQRKFDEAEKFYIQSIELQQNPIEKAKTYYILATTLFSTDLPKSKEYISKAVAADPKMGKAYLFLAQQYANSFTNCGTDFEKKAVFNLAAQTAQQAAVAEPRLKPTADKMSEDYTKKGLTATEISKAKMNGKTITIGCSINETFTFPNKK